MTYAEKLKSPKWQKKRLEIMERDGFQCQMCFDREETLTVHHKYYTKNTAPWDYDNECYITLCEDCHESVHSFEKRCNKECTYTYMSNYTDFRIMYKRLEIIMNLEGEQCIKTVNQLLTAYVIHLKDI